MSKAGERVLQICGINSWIFGIFPTSTPWPAGFQYEFTSKRPGVLYSLIIGILHIAMLTDTLFTRESPSHPHKDNTTYFYEDFLTKIMLAVLLITNLSTRFTGLFRCDTICRLLQNIGQLKSKLSDPGNESENPSNRTYAFYIFSIFSFWARTLAHLTSDLTSARPFYKQTFIYVETDSFDWFFILVYVVSFLGYAIASYFAYTLTYVTGTELSQLYTRMCKELARIRADAAAVSTKHPSLYADHHLSLEPDPPRDNFQEERIVTNRSITYLRQDFKQLFEQFQTYRNVCGLLCVALLAESTYCFFYCLSDIISMGENRRECSEAGAFVNLLIFLSLVDLGNTIETKIRNQSADIKYAHASDAHYYGSFENKESTVQLVALETWVMDWSWRFNAMDLFTMNRSLITGVLGVITSYVMIVLQMKMSGGSTASSPPQPFQKTIID